MVADEKTFSHIAVTADDDDDFVIEAGRRDAAPIRPAAVQPRPASKADADVRVSGDADSSVDVSAVEHGDSSDAEADAREAKPAREGDSYRQTQLDDLKSAPMSTMQKAVIAVAGLLIVGFVVYYCFLR